MNFAVMLSLSIIALLLAANRFRAIRWSDVHKDNGIALDVWWMTVFFSVTMIFLVKKFCNFFDDLTLNNLDRLIAYSSILTGMFFGAKASAGAVGGRVHTVVVRWLGRALIVIIASLAVIYAVFMWRLPNIDYFIPRSLPEVFFMLVTFCFGVVLCLFVARVYAVYLPHEASRVMRLRAALIILSSCLACAYFLVKTILALGFFWPLLGHWALIELASGLLVLSALSHFSALFSNRLYLPTVIIFRNVGGWWAFKDLRRLMEQLRRLCPEVILPATKPSLWSYLADPEFHLYSAVIAIMDGKTMLDDLLLEGALHGEPALWEGDLLHEAIRVKGAMRVIVPSDDFWKVVSQYRQVSRELFLGRGSTAALQAVEP